MERTKYEAGRKSILRGYWLLAVAFLWPKIPLLFGIYLVALGTMRLRRADSGYRLALFFLVGGAVWTIVGAWMKLAPLVVQAGEIFCLACWSACLLWAGNRRLKAEAETTAEEGDRQSFLRRGVVSFFLLIGGTAASCWIRRQTGAYTGETILIMLSAVPVVLLAYAPWMAYLSESLAFLSPKIQEAGGDAA